jgi:two-component system, response regulator PdtaR
MKNSATRVLVVEDDHLVSEMVRGMLEELGYEVSGIAEDGHEALEMLRELKPDVVLMDIKMPRMSGIQASILIQKHFPTPVAILSAYETEELVRNAFDAGVGAYVVKPPEPQDLFRGIEVAIGRFGDMRKIAELEERVQECRNELTRLASLLPVCPKCGGKKTGDKYSVELENYIRELSDEEIETYACSRCRKSTAAGREG